MDNATLSRNVDLAPVIGDLKNTDAIKDGSLDFNDFYRNMERFFGKHFHLVKPLVDSFDSAKAFYMNLEL